MVQGAFLFYKRNIDASAGSGNVQCLFAASGIGKIGGSGTCLCNDGKIIFASLDASSDATAFGVEFAGLSDVQPAEFQGAGCGFSNDGINCYICVIMSAGTVLSNDLFCLGIFKTDGTAGIGKFYVLDGCYAIASDPAGSSGHLNVFCFRIFKFIASGGCFTAQILALDGI